MLRPTIALSCLLVIVANATSAQTTRLAVLQADNRRAPTAADLATLRSGARSEDVLIARPAVRAMGRLERPALIPDLIPYLKHDVPEIRSEAANAIAQAAQPWRRETPPRAAFDAVLAALTSRLNVEGVADVRAALADAIGRFPYPSDDAASRGAQAILAFDGRAESVTDRLGVSRGLEAFTRLTKKLGPPPPGVVEALRRLATPRGDGAADARVRRLAFDALQSASAVPDDLALAGLRDPDAQVRRLAARAAPAASLLDAVHDSAAMVRLEALTQLKARKADEMCGAALTAATDTDTAVSLIAIDQLSGCAASPDAVALLDRTASETEGVAARTWHRPAHAIVSLAAVAPERATDLLPHFSSSSIWQMRMYAARAAAALRNRAALDALAFDADDNVRETTVNVLRTLAGHDADATYVSQLTRRGNQILRAAAVALEGTADRSAAVPALKAALERVNADGGDNAHDARDAIVKTLTSLGEPATVPTRRVEETGIDAAELKRLAAPRARVTIRGVGSFELALITAEAPATVLRFAQLAESGYYNGLTFHRVVPNFVVQGGSPGANEYVGASPFMRDEVGQWPHVRGAVGISTRGRDTGDAQIFVDLVDNPRLDHEYTVFAQVLNGLEIVDQILEGDVIEKIEIIN